MLDEGASAAFVHAWLERATTALTGAQRLELLERSLEALWRRANATLGVVSLVPIAERVVTNAIERFPALRGLTVGPDGFDLAALRAHTHEPAPDDVAAWTTALLTGFLAVLGRLTADVLTPILRDALSAVELPVAERARRATPPTALGTSTNGAKESKP